MKRFPDLSAAELCLNKTATSFISLHYTISRRLSVKTGLSAWIMLEMKSPMKENFNVYHSESSGNANG